jgi:hypothetical protein
MELYIEIKNVNVNDDGVVSGDWELHADEGNSMVSSSWVNIEAMINHHFENSDDYEQEIVCDEWRIESDECDGNGFFVGSVK